MDEPQTQGSLPASDLQTILDALGDLDQKWVLLLTPPDGADLGDLKYDPRLTTHEAMNLVVQSIPVMRYAELGVIDYMYGVSNEAVEVLECTRSSSTASRGRRRISKASRQAL